jgi:hypothetical protein
VLAGHFAVVQEKSDERDIPTDSYSEGPLFEVAAFYNGHLTTQEGARTIEDLM